MRLHTSAWMFQANPKEYNLLGALNDPEVGNTVHWTVNQYSDQIKSGHFGIIWMSEPNAGIYAIANIVSNPAKMKESEAEKRYWLDSSRTVEMALRVEMYITHNLTDKPILKTKLHHTAGLSNLLILRQPQSTNFPVTDSEWKIIWQLISGL